MASQMEIKLALDNMSLSSEMDRQDAVKAFELSGYYGGLRKDVIIRGFHY
jgi:hypothetical protein